MKKLGITLLILIGLFILAVIIVAIVDPEMATDTDTEAPASRPGPATTKPEPEPESEPEPEPGLVTEEMITDVRIYATYDCKLRIEAQAKYTHEWTDGFLNSAFTRYSTTRTAEGYITIGGDKLYFTNGFGAKVPMVYTCTVDPGNNYRVIEVSVTER